MIVLSMYVFQLAFSGKFIVSAYFGGASIWMPFLCVDPYCEITVLT